MESATGSTERRGSVLASFLLPQPFLDPATDGDTPEVRAAKMRRNKAWLLRWLPVYLRRWAVLFLAFWLLATLTALLGFPPVLGWAFEFAQATSVGVAVWLSTLYVRSRLAPF